MAGQIAGLILAGGRSSRMGGTDKTLLPLGGRPMVVRVLDRLQPQAAPIAINTNADAALFANFGADIVADTIAGHQGPLAGILAGLEWAAQKPGVSHLLSVAGDTPFFPADLAVQLASRGDHGAVAASNGRMHPTFALWPLSLRDGLAAFLESGDTRRVMTFIEQAGLYVVDFPTVPFGAGTVDPFFNINTPGDLAEAERILDGAN
ncbi:molybdenum cofactor guanylyltransferase MobA [Aminobacter aganoensis]|uniref:Molybdenum cofactor guanylyltransferase n=1 Tax=Aminobacter aganoensis TaxID=83264 RepID=A0A7X0F422_9HYPH|nr:molybdenum cofactor guanylyltransferase MobA [Aminobacter aganoensis]MBB6352658.1 molybdopterin-guanine dinucleotide biosynthesis protein A [Aminobacter aganoensis]